jgi:hypothetical protein
VDAAAALFAGSQAHFRAALSHEIRGRSVVGGAAAAAAAAGAAAEPPQVS